MSDHMSDQKNVRFAVIGTNFITGRFIEAALQCERFEWTAVYSRRVETARAFAEGFSALKRLDGASAIENVQFLNDLSELEMAENIDAVYIASPTSLHSEQSVRLLRAGKHVLCEKPVASNLAEWQRMVDASVLGNATVMEAMRPIFTPGFHKVRGLLSGLGKIRKVSFSYCQYSSRYDKYKHGIVENAFRREFSNGALMDIGVYCVAVMVALFGMPKRITAHGYILPESIDGMGSIVAMYDGMQADLSYSKISDSRLPCEIQGEDGTLSFNQIGAPQDIVMRWRDGTEEHVEVPFEPKDIIYETKAFLRILAGEESADRPHEISAMTMSLLDEARRQMGIVFPADGPS